MKLHILSDVHVEFGPYDAPETDADVVVLAGDIHVGRNGFDWAREQFPNKPVLYVLGNHEYYGKALPKFADKLRELAEGTNVHILEQDSLTLDGVTFLGCTLWTDFELFGDPRIAGYEAAQKMTDYKRIRVSPNYRRLHIIKLRSGLNRTMDICTVRWVKSSINWKTGMPPKKSTVLLWK